MRITNQLTVGMLAVTTAASLGVVSAGGATAPSSAQSATSAAVRHLEELHTSAHPESPARFRIVEELDRLRYGTDAGGSSSAMSSAGEISQFRALEDSLGT